MPGNGAPDDRGLQAEQAIEEFRSATQQAIRAWSDAKLDAVIARLRREGSRTGESIALLMFLEDARLRRHEARAYSDGKGADPPRTIFQVP